MKTGHLGEDHGESLVEILLSIMIIGIAVTAILGGVGLAARASTQDERQIQAQAMLRSWAEHIQARTTDGNFDVCAKKATYGPTSDWSYTNPPPAGLDTLPAGFDASVARVEYWAGSATGWVDAETASTAACAKVDPATGATNPNSGVQRLLLRMAVADGLYPGFASTYQVVVRRPCENLAATAVVGC